MVESRMWRLVALASFSPMIAKLAGLAIGHPIDDVSVSDLGSICGLAVMGPVAQIAAGMTSRLTSAILRIAAAASICLSGRHLLQVYPFLRLSVFSYPRVDLPLMPIVLLMMPGLLLQTGLAAWYDKSTDSRGHRMGPTMKKQLTFTIVLRPEPEGGFTVRVPALPEIVTFGDDETHALAMAREAIELAVEHRLDIGDVIPDAATPIHELTITLPSAA